MKKYICFDGVDGDITYHETIEEALKKLKNYIDDGLDDGEWYEGIEDSFVAEINHFVKPKKIETPDDYFKDSGIRYFTEMEIIKK